MNSEADKQAFTQLIQDNKGIIFKVCNAYCANIHDREDLAQEIIYNVWKSWSGFDNSHKFSTWMYRIALNVAISSYRKQSRNTSTISIDANEKEIADTTERHDAATENTLLLEQFINELNTLDRALMLLYIDGKSYAEIAVILGITETNTATKINRIKNNLKQKVSGLNK
ncbi:sigma-70 family RNA polymerase sigma factor [Panacibacter ginsenosidivorans]|uniref:Sigma-70 family RNA polymerase sigma factor n=1 Tax=Panacibacter ginsenosidivorans TaxID=1813871 RepID=A0A5B8VFK7_9BACT|nr:sigma-70 family RNA polymerase sigma factor [Panacibacter ginsenosidivorans]QEC69772.1 sigma-70 family RNA polymerase sigma factor [Panacibacter ginsenosidivorans]